MSYLRFATKVRPDVVVDDCGSPADTNLVTPFPTTVEAWTSIDADNSPYGVYDALYGQNRSAPDFTGERVRCEDRIIVEMVGLHFNSWCVPVPLLPEWAFGYPMSASLRAGDILTWKFEARGSAPAPNPTVEYAHLDMDIYDLNWNNLDFISSKAGVDGNPFIDTDWQETSISYQATEKCMVYVGFVLDTNSAGVGPDLDWVEARNCSLTIFR